MNLTLILLGESVNSDSKHPIILEGKAGETNNSCKMLRRKRREEEEEGGGKKREERQKI